jgi:hypothetical protein
VDSLFGHLSLACVRVSECAVSAKAMLQGMLFTIAWKSLEEKWARERDHGVSDKK